MSHPAPRGRGDNAPEWHQHVIALVSHYGSGAELAIRMGVRVGRTYAWNTRNEVPTPTQRAQLAALAADLAPGNPSPVLDLATETLLAAHQVLNLVLRADDFETALDLARRGHALVTSMTTRAQAGLRQLNL